MPNITSVTLTAGVPTAGTGTVGTLDNVTGTAGAPSVPVLTVQGVASGTAQPISGTVTANATLAAETTKNIGSIRVTDGTNTATVKAVSTAPVTATDQALVVAMRPDSPGIISTGTAGSASATVLTVQGIASMTALKTDGSAVTQPISNAYLTEFGTGYYVTVAASATATVLQSSVGATGDYISGVLVIPATTSPGNVLLLDNATSITVFAGGATSVSNLVPFFIPLGAVSRSGAWKLTTGTNVSCVAVGKFS